MQIYASCSSSTIFLFVAKIECGFETLTFMMLDRLQGIEGELPPFSLQFLSCRVASRPSFVNSAAADTAFIHSPPMKLQPRPFFVGGRRQKRNNPLASCELAGGPPFMTSTFFGFFLDTSPCLTGFSSQERAYWPVFCLHPALQQGRGRTSSLLGSPNRQTLDGSRKRQAAQRYRI